jgi:hypothetical protein
MKPNEALLIAKGYGAWVVQFTSKAISAPRVPARYDNTFIVSAPHRRPDPLKTGRVRQKYRKSAGGETCGDRAGAFFSRETLAANLTGDPVSDLENPAPNQ